MASMERQVLVVGHYTSYVLEGTNGTNGTPGPCPSTTVTGTGFAILNNGTSCGQTPLIQVNETAVILGGDPVPVQITGQLQLLSATNQFTLGGSGSNRFTVTANSPVSAVTLTISDPGLAQVPLQLGSWSTASISSATLLSTSQSGVRFGVVMTGAAYQITLPSPSTSKGVNYYFHPQQAFGTDVTIMLSSGNNAGFLTQVGATPQISAFGAAPGVSQILFSSTGGCDVEDFVSLWSQGIRWQFDAWTGSACFQIA